ncbi:hypothetical protein BD779DRAFT_436377 [Infundibulicybe gibba]|nr:hypothetical protein BD779DRAFT_436377 [Infundibulicybe gibba]
MIRRGREDDRAGYWNRLRWLADPPPAAGYDADAANYVVNWLGIECSKMSGVPQSTGHMYGARQYRCQACAELRTQRSLCTSPARPSSSETRGGVGRMGSCRKAKSIREGLPGGPSGEVQAFKRDVRGRLSTARSSHQQAFKRCRILHHDVSKGSVVVTVGGMRMPNNRDPVKDVEADSVAIW